MSARPTAFYAPARAANRDNAWCDRNGFSVPAHYGDVESEAMAARMSVIVADISWRTRVRMSGARAEECVSRLATRDARRLSPGNGFKALWLNDTGALRGAGLFARLAANEFEIVSAASDHAWFGSAARLFGVEARDVTTRDGGLALIGPCALHVLAEAGIDNDLDLLSIERRNWQGTELALSRFGEHGGYEVWCPHRDAAFLWDRLAEAGRPYGLVHAGALAMDVLDVEAGVPRPWRDYVPARGLDATSPLPRTLGMEGLIDTAHFSFNGYRSWSETAPAERTIAGILFDGDDPSSFARIRRDNETIGTTLFSAYSPALRRAIALAQIDVESAASGLEVSVEEPERLGHSGRTVSAWICDLPFMPTPDPIPR
ncbi:MAG: aminomethyltransferase family protein [Alphaproteobacteria bacterium]|nr:aminomethyltransferase family protein [Alphaproteobacteria bacterium]